MKAITLHQPFATLVAMGFKRFETRSWKTEYRGPLAIHSAARFPRECRKLAETPAFRYALRGRELPLGVVVATCELASVVSTQIVVDQYELPLGFAHGMLLSQFLFGDFSEGRFAWTLKEIRALPAPIPATGAQRLWNWDGGPSQL